MMKKFWGCFLLIIFLTGCRTVPSRLPPAGQHETSQDIEKAVTAVTGAVSGDRVQVKYCPVDGEHFSAKLENCPVHGVKLIQIEE